MLWFGPKKFKLIVHDKELEKEIRKNSYHYIVDLALKNGLPCVAELIQQGKLSPNFLKATVQLIELGKGDTLYRGIKKGYYRDFLKYGNTKTSENISEIEAYKFKKYGLDPSQVLYADTHLSKAWETVEKENPSIIILYDENKLEQIPHIMWYAYKLKEGENFKDAVKAYVILWYK